VHKRLKVEKELLISPLYFLALERVLDAMPTTRSGSIDQAHFLFHGFHAYSQFARIHPADLSRTKPTNAGQGCGRRLKHFSEETRRVAIWKKAAEVAKECGKIIELLAGKVFTSEEHEGTSEKKR
jgi:hypothetical protein